MAILLSPVIAVGVSVYLQARRELRERKERIFAALMAHRKAYPPERDWVRALNLIDVVFAEDLEVLKLWHEYFGLLCSAKNQLSTTCARTRCSTSWPRWVESSDTNV